MARKFDMIKDIDGKRETLKLVVRIVDMWFVESWDSKRNMEMILTDQKGDVIPAMIKKEDIATWEDKVKEGESYIMHNFKILNNRAQYRVCDHPYKLLFIGATSVRRQPIASIPAKVWKFKSIKDIIDGNYSADLLVDVIGVVDNVEEKPSYKNVVFDLKDLSGASICCTLWDSYCLRLVSYWRESRDTAYPAIILTQAKIKAASGPWPVSLSNCWNGSKLFMGDDISELIEFRKEFSKTTAHEIFEEGSQYSGSSQISHVDRFMYKTVVKSVSQILTVIEEISCVTVAHTLKFNLGNHGWSYLVCNLCAKRTYEVGSFKCLNCDGYNEYPKMRYKLEIQVTDGKKVANFMLWDQDCINLIGLSAGDLRKKMIKDGEEDPKCFPQDLDVLLGCTLAFKVKPQGNNRPASVMRVSTDREIIGHISSLLGQTEVMEIVEAKENCSDQSELRKGKSIAIEVGKRRSASESDVHTHTGSSLALELAECGDNAACDLSADTDSSLMCLSRTADLDPDVVLCVTPRKNLSTTSDNEDMQYIPENFMDFDLLEDLPLAQLSATKTMKIIKKEK
ncbi:replication protein A 70 kDa DNA-binding subunit E-like [Vigna unguiculata]|uniref:replication protein A 70 kDa DNA-binding subunit E-like n=1 Tax=Vigna unguiculata TaxID=3917 RepID=UPI001015D78E|nr:replication protein A 70 kDa DNA-binding subunit E-like [Vigna unguiculata]